MLTPLDFLQDLTNPLLSFLPKALVVSALSALICGVVGCHVQLRGMAFIGDAIAHAVFPGIAVAFVMQGSFLLGGLIAGVITAILIAVIGQHQRLGTDSVIGVLFVSAFALGLVIMSRAPGYSGSLTTFLFGSITGIPDSAVLSTGIFTIVVLVLLVILHRPLTAVGMDRTYAAALGLPVLVLDIALSVLVTLAVVMSVQTIGNILVIALLITPAACARLLTDRIVPMMTTAAGVGVLSAFLGIYLSWALDLPTGAAIVLVCTGFFILAWLFSPRHGILRRSHRGKSQNPVPAESTNELRSSPASTGAAVAAGTEQ